MGLSDYRFSLHMITLFRDANINFLPDLLNTLSAFAAYNHAYLDGLYAYPVYFPVHVKHQASCRLRFMPRATASNNATASKARAA